MKCSLLILSFCLMFCHCVLAIPLPDNINYEKPSVILPRTSIYSTASFERDPTNPTLPSNRRGQKFDGLNQYDVYHLRNLEEPVFVSAFQLPVDGETSRVWTAQSDDVATAGDLSDSFNLIRASMDTTTWEIMTLAGKQSEKQ